MYEYLRGKVVHTEKETLTLEIENIGYLIYCSNPFVFDRNEEEITIYTYQYVKEDVIRLYGFPSRKERGLFEQLLQVSGIGPKGALAVLAAGAPQQVIQAIEEENEAFLVKFPGVGKKTARQMILDLKGKLQDIVGEPAGNGDLGLLQENSQSVSHSNALDEALEALRALGYSEKEISKVKPALQKEQLSADEYVRQALQKMLT
ncbi:Holliday junction DNA helicase subunit RuvA [Alteribacillus persepolensis]|uniref:Holliday junction branch migration complex subunit RuvA n=1 Tax=Alteribacillus persepolensis TaxID=568899 RepID=A0A1G8DH09_9BACI|nr:Holliday junction branch migration protein RuvA [Alteribacillus persepolensis]SDH56923.1 Holliday junction DNA helicase subunit RuvA [Alteribacillus persepolensis]